MLEKKMEKKEKEETANVWEVDYLKEYSCSMILKFLLCFFLSCWAFSCHWSHSHCCRLLSWGEYPRGIVIELVGEGSRFVLLGPIGQIPTATCGRSSWSEATVAAKKKGKLETGWVQQNKARK